MKTSSWMLARPAFWAAIAVQLVAANQIWVALYIVRDPGTFLREHLLPLIVGFAGVVTVSPFSRRIRRGKCWLPLLLRVGTKVP